MKLFNFRKKDTSLTKKEIIKDTKQAPKDTVSPVDKNICAKCQKDLSSEWLGLYECSKCSRRYCVVCVSNMQSSGSICICGSVALVTVV